MPLFREGNLTIKILRLLKVGTRNEFGVALVQQLQQEVSDGKVENDRLHNANRAQQEHFATKYGLLEKENASYCKDLQEYMEMVTRQAETITEEAAVIQKLKAKIRKLQINLSDDSETDDMDEVVRPGNSSVQDPSRS
ncbi:unnamed protein product [Clonostachys solani]|uniref:Uncharacterized protein n=1 Tax=Clonostachys solani TaxID=160281 RepID=A0A9N9W9G8_9HYPO|nr:unnamed protein product [Clonostachys solani]